ncbi:MAG: 3'(2'),5'-bisphosphate nucleotidase CysQ [Acidobacteria bacterium]|nr:3'(2'),5'-bisphosphate nucleotidase CysQ [Acidobacteriota bacterium]
MESSKRSEGETSPNELLSRIENALKTATLVASAFINQTLKVDYKTEFDPVTEADREVNAVLQELLLRDGEGWLSEETTDDLSRLEKEAVWIIDPIDGTKEFISGIPEWAISVAYVVNGKPLAGGISNPATNELVIGAIGAGVLYNGAPTAISDKQTLAGAVILGSRSEAKRGEWDRFNDAIFTVRHVGSVAYKLGLVAAGIGDATWTLVPKHEWDVAAGVALIEAAGGFVRGIEPVQLRFNQERPLLRGLIAGPLKLKDEIEATLGL